MILKQIDLLLSKDEQEIFSIENKRKRSAYVNLNVSGNNVGMEVDTEACVTIIYKKIYMINI